MESGTSRRRANAAVITLAALVTVVCSLPLYMLGALAPQINETLPLAASHVGIVMAAYWLAAGVGSALTVRFARAFSDRAVMAVAVAVVIAGLAAAALVASETWHLIAIIGATGVANGLGHAPANSRLQSRLPSGAQGLGFGVKQAAIPLASVLAGLSVPIFGATLGWRWALAAGALLCVPSLVAVLRSGQRSRDELASSAEPGAGAAMSRAVTSKVLQLSIVTLLGAGAFAASAALVTTVSDVRGWSVEVAAVALAVSSLVGAVLRVAATSMPRSSLQRTFGLLVTLLALGAVGMLLMSVPVEGAFLTGMLLVHGPGWAWPGILHFVAAQVSDGHVGAATGIVQLMVSISSAVVPIVAGLLLARFDPTAAWIVLFGLTAASSLWGACISMSAGFFRPQHDHASTAERPHLRP